MRDFEEFAAVNDPREYLNAPAMVLMDNADSHNSKTSSTPPKLPLVLGASIDYAAEFEVLSNDELQQYYAEQLSLERRLKDLVNRLDVEIKMREAAQSISRLHSGDATSSGNRRASLQSIRSSSKTNIATSPKLNQRLSKIFSQDAQTKPVNRLSKQAADEADVSSEKIKELKKIRSGIEGRKAMVEIIILRHHCAVMSRALSSKPLPNHHQRSRSGASNLSQNSNRQSWIMAPNHQRQWSSNSNGDSASLATVTEYNSTPGSLGLPASPNIHSSQLEVEVDNLIARITTAFPQFSPSSQGKVMYLTNVFERLMRNLTEKRDALEASQVQIDHTKQRLQYITQQYDELQANCSSRELAMRNPGNEVALRESRNALEAEQAKSSIWRARVDQQRQQLEDMTKSLEDVTQLAVRLESSQSNYEQLVVTLEAKIDRLLTEKKEFLQRRIKATANQSLLCQEFQKTVSDLISRHDEEVRMLYPKFPKKRLPMDLSLSQVDLVEKKPTQSEMEQPKMELSDHSRLSRNSSDLQDSAPGHKNENKSKSEALNRSSSYESSELKSPSDPVAYQRTPSPLQVLESTSGSMRPTGSSYDDSIQHTEKEYMNRPVLGRHGTGTSDYSNSSSYYPEAQSPNQSQVSIIVGGAQTRGRTSQSRKFSYENDDDEIL